MSSVLGRPRFIEKEDIVHFLKIIDTLSSFESDQRLIRGYGAFTKEEIETFPDKTFIKVKCWLEDTFGLPSSQ